ncbi:MAG: HI0074 family nucleotidyltransferase substrate-binding subunit [Cyanobacteria bacterium P01_H01_bin.74]
MSEIRAAKAFQNFSKTLKNLERTLKLPEDNEDYRNSALLSFVLACEQCWKLLKWVLKEYIAIEARGPKPSIQEAYLQGWLSETDETWLDMADDRNLLSHTYDESQALEIYRRVKNDYAVNMRKLHTLLKEKYPKLQG